MPPHLLDIAVEKQRRNSYSAFSDYIQELIRKDNPALLQPIR